MTETERCNKHGFERAVGHCGQCGRGYCQDCLLQPFPKRPPICKSCAMSAAGIRKGAAVRPIASKAEIKAMDKARRKQEKEAAKALQAARSVAAGGAVPTDANPFAHRGVVPPPPEGAPKPARTKRLWRTT